MPQSSCRKRPFATVSYKTTIILTNFRQQKEEFLAVEVFHDQVDCSIPSVDYELVNPDDVVVLKFGHVLKLGLEVQDHFIVSCLDYFDGEVAIGCQLTTALDEANCPFAELLEFLESILEAFET